jgi:hypothetical protein
LPKIAHFTQVVGAIAAAAVLYVIASGKSDWVPGGFASNVRHIMLPTADDTGNRGAEGGRLEPDLDSTPEKFRRVLEGEVAHRTPVVNVIGLKID